MQCFVSLFFCCQYQCSRLPGKIGLRNELLCVEWGRNVIVKLFITPTNDVVFCWMFVRITQKLWINPVKIWGVGDPWDMMQSIRFSGDQWLAKEKHLISAHYRPAYLTSWDTVLVLYWIALRDSSSSLISTGINECIFWHVVGFCELSWLSYSYKLVKMLSVCIKDLRIVFMRSNRISNRIGRPIRLWIEFLNRIGRIYHASRNTV